MKYTFTLSMLLFGFFSCQDGKELPTVSEVDLQKYAGTWYEIARLPNRFEKGLECVTATYTVEDNGKIGVLNRGVKSADGSQSKDIKGKAWVPDNAYPGRLKVQFFWPFAADYYILALDENYQYALIGSPSRKFLWLLSKTGTMPESIERDYRQQAKNLGFNVEALEAINQSCNGQ